MAGILPANSRKNPGLTVKTTKDSRLDGLFRGLQSRLSQVTPSITETIRAEVPGYQPLPYAEHAVGVTRQIHNVVEGLVNGTVPTAPAIEHARKVGRRRAAAGMALPDVIEAYHIAYREIWSELLADARRHDPPLDGSLTSAVSLLWLWFHRLSAAVAEGHAAESQLRRSNRIALERELLDQLTGRALADDAIAAELGFQADSEFTVACVAGLGQGDATDRLADALGGRDAPHGSGPRVACIQHADHAVVLAQDLDLQQLTAAVTAVRPTARIGIGIRRPGLAGARLSLRDAQDAVARATEDRRVVEFEHDWLMCCLGSIRPRFAAILEPTAAVARRHPDLAATVRAYAECRYSVSACARRMSIHPNSARYRLDRWKALTGHDVETVDGLAASLIALELAPQDPALVG